MDKVKLRIDNVRVETEVGVTVLEAARKKGIYIPSLCSRPGLPRPLGNCRVCVVQIEGRGLASSCSTPVAPEMTVYSNVPLVQEIRRHILRAVLSPLPAPRLKHPDLARLAEYVGVKEGDLPEYVPRSIPMDWEGAAVELDRRRCILCGLCVRACHELRGVGAIDFVIQGGKLVIGPSRGSSLKDAACRFCGACIEVCPTGALTEKDGDGESHKAGIVPCTHACPAQVDVPRYVHLVAQRRFAEAAAVVREKIPLLGTVGRVCLHPCEEECRRAHLNEAISIAGLKRVCGERDAGIWRSSSKVAASTGKRVAIVGSGPAGLTAGFYLAKLGHSATVLEALPEAGGMMRVGIPPYRLPREVLYSDIKEIGRVGIEIKTGAKVESLDGLFAQGYDAVFLGIGAHKGIRMGISGEERPGVRDCISFLTDVNLGRAIKLPARVAVIGGGNAAIDAARTALRVGASEVTIIYRRSRAEMPASAEEVRQALEEGVKIIFLAEPVRITGGNGMLKVECIRTALGEPDATGRRRPVRVKGSEFVSEFDEVIGAVGQMPDVPGRFGLDIDPRNNTIKVDPATLATSREGVFAGGDAVRGPTSVVWAIADGRRAAASIDKYLGGSGIITETLVETEEPSPWLGRKEGFADMSRAQMPSLSLKQRAHGFAEVELGLTEEMAIKEAERCLRCELRLKIPPIVAPPQDAPVLRGK